MELSQKVKKRMNDKTSVLCFRFASKKHKHHAEQNIYDTMKLSAALKWKEYRVTMVAMAMLLLIW